jgi:hypothetical protein
MTVVEVACPDCGARVALCDNNVLLDMPAVERSDEACWTVIQAGGLSLAAAGGPPPASGRGHRLHDHQPPEP